MKKYLITLLVLFIFPLSLFALNDEYKDIVSPITNSKVEKNKINIYLFKGETCPHCKEEKKWLKTIKNKYNVNIYEYEVWNDKENANYLDEVKNILNDNVSKGVPYTVIGDKYYLGFSEAIKSKIESQIREYLNYEEDSKNINLPILGNSNIKQVSIPLVAIILGFIDGFNPCAMWILLLLINICITLKDKKKMKIIGYTFIISSGFIYLLSMLGLGIIVNLSTIVIIRKIIASIAIVLGIYNIYIYFKTRKESGCHVVKKEKRKSIITRINKIINQKNLIIMLFSTIFFAASVNLIELACSLGFPTIFLEILTLNNINGITKYIYLLIYILFYLIDDLVVLMLSIKAFEIKGISTKYNKYVNLIGGILMMIIGILLIFKPEWIMLNF